MTVFLRAILTELSQQFTAWSQTIEQALHRTRSRDTASNVPCLPPRYRGRCQWQPPRRVRPARTPRAAWSGIYNPTDEVLSLRAHHKVRQTRRIQGLYKSLVSARSRVLHSHQQHQRLLLQWHQEWQAILSAQGYGSSFANWLLGHDDFWYVPTTPPDDFLFDVLQLVQHDSDAHTRQEAKQRRDHFCSRPAIFGEATVNIQSIQDDRAQVAATGPTKCPTRGILSQTSTATSLAELDHVFISYWHQFWGRDEQVPNSTSNDAIETVTACSHHLPDIQIPWSDLGAWEHVLAATTSGSAVGADGWRFEELKLLPQAAVRQLVTLYQHALCLGAFPSEFMQARKKENPRFATDARPIAILGRLVGLFTKFAAFFILRPWAQSFPSAVAGGLPNRDVRVFTLLQQQENEQATTNSRPLAGMSLDLVKAYNLLPRAPLQPFLLHLGVPANLVTVCFPILSSLTRRLSFRGHCGTSSPSATGVPGKDVPCQYVRWLHWDIFIILGWSRPVFALLSLLTI